MYNCTLVARDAVERYCQKYKDGDCGRVNQLNRSTMMKAKNEFNTDENEQIKSDQPSFSADNICEKSTSAPEGLNISTFRIDKNAESEIDASKKQKRRKRKLFHADGDVIKGENRKRKKPSVDIESKINVDPNMFVDINSNIIDVQSESPNKFEESKFNFNEIDLPFTDDNTISSSVIEPRSPGLLLKRSQNNKWHVAKADLPLNLDGKGPENTADIVENDAKSNKNSKSGNAKLRKKIKGPLKLFTNTTSKGFLDKKTKMHERMSSLASIEKLGIKALKKVDRSTKKGKYLAVNVDNGEKVLFSESDLEKDFCDEKPESTRSDTTSLQHQDFDHRKSLQFNCSTFKDSLILNQNKGENSNKTDAKFRKKKEKRPIETKSFSLIETIPYRSLLVVKDGDLCPSYTMSYSENNSLPGCCHALWRWRLGKPLKISNQSPKADHFLMKRQASPSPAKSMEDFKFPPKGQPSYLNAQFPIKNRLGIEFQLDTKLKEMLEVEQRDDELSNIKGKLDEEIQINGIVDEKCQVDENLKEISQGYNGVYEEFQAGDKVSQSQTGKSLDYQRVDERCRMVSKYELPHDGKSFDGQSQISNMIYERSQTDKNYELPQSDQSLDGQCQVDKRVGEESHTDEGFDAVHGPSQIDRRVSRKVEQVDVVNGSVSF